MAYAQKGDKPKALKELQKALRSSPAKTKRTRSRI
jgi:Tfp pilus assembly protein PilF